ncbi:hypothetical protein HOE31_03545 [bacterium]|nr:hypothetical protein [bacterium]MBT4335248.1 hypothetical protein [bacterium]MBT4763530.1 hypothetical protein [bacterium]MBT5400901.1 hypothetical protein [bacterium]MBT5942222.1 hypothetical protein [bacterium]
MLQKENIAISRIIDLIPHGTKLVKFLGRHAKSVQKGTQETRTLSEKGVDLCKDVSYFYGRLFLHLRDSYGEFEYCSSEWPRSLLTTFLTTKETQIVMLNNMTIPVGASLKNLNDGEWFRERKAKKMTVVEMIQEFLKNRDVLGGKPFDEYEQAYISWVMEDIYSKAGFFHEIGCTLAAIKLGINPEEAGLNECQGYLFCLDNSAKVLSVIKVAPPATLE